MVQSSLLPAFLAGFVCCGGLAAALWPTLLAPMHAELRSARDEVASVQRSLSQERLMHQQLDAARDATHRLSRDTCEQEVAKATADASAKAQEACKCPAPEICQCEERPSADGAHTAESLAPAPITEPPPPPPPPQPPSTGDDAGRVADEPSMSACMHAVSVLGDSRSAAAKWVLTPAADGTRPPAGADEVLLSYRSHRHNRTLVAAERVVHRLGDDSLWAPMPGWSAAVGSMRQGERAAFRFAPPINASTDPDLMAATFEVEILEITRVEDLSPTAGMSVFKTVLEAGVGAETPSDGARVAIELSAAGAPPSGEQAAAGGTAATTASRLDFVLGSGTGGDGLRRALMSMTRSELARVRIHPSLARAPLNASTSGGGGRLVVATVRLVSFEQPKSIEHMSQTELIEHVTGLKAAANARFAAGETDTACGEYDRAQRLLRLVVEADLSPAEASSWRGVQLSLRLNAAACALRSERFDQALVQSDAALSLAPESTKALFRKGQALQGLGRLGEAEAAYTTVVARDPASREAHARLAQISGQRGVPSSSTVQVAADGSTSTTVPLITVLPATVLSSTAPAASSAMEAAAQAAGAAAGAEDAELAKARQMSPAQLIEHVTGLKAAANARFAAGETDTACGEYDRAQRLLRLVVEADLSPAEASSWRGVQLSLRLNAAACALRSERFDQALVQSDAALSLAPESTKALFRKGQALQGLGRLGEAEAAYTTVVARDPASREAHARLASLRK